MRLLKLLYLFNVILILFAVFFARNVSADSLSKIIYLTFDADMTHHMQAEQKSGLVKKWYDPMLIEYLENNDIPATFFITGMFANMYPDLIKHIAANPNFSIQNHTFDHRAFEPHCYHLPFVVSDEQKKIEIQRTQNILHELTGRTPTYFRYPGLCHDTHDDSVVATEGLLLASVEISSGDAYLRNPEAVVNHVLKNLNHGNVVVFHMGTTKSPAAADAIKLLVPRLKKMGYVLNHL